MQGARPMGCSASLKRIGLEVNGGDIHGRSRRRLPPSQALLIRFPLMLAFVTQMGRAAARVREEIAARVSCFPVGMQVPSFEIVLSLYC